MHCGRKTTMMLSGAATAAVIRLARPRGAAAASPASSYLSDLFRSQCILSNNSSSNGISSRSIANTAACGWHRRPGDVAARGGGSDPLRVDAMGIRMMNTARRFSSSESGDGGSPSGDAAEELPSTISGSSQHDTWVEFQRNISISGFDTGQTVKERRLNQKNRGGALARKRKEREAEALAALKGVDNTQLKGGEFPELRYSDEETERLLAEAYAAIPPRGGRRGTRNLNRQKRRWWIKRQYDYKKKYEAAAAYTRKMKKKEVIKADIKRVRDEAGEIRMNDAQYHNMVLQRWADMSGHNEGLQALEESRRMELTSSGWKI